ncbi:hypothetical protein NQ315_017528 [Exocentrus adspersus]|uniref:Uncharacterized protein n=1 Tax=Exocentrus adspersus TaxID=1586481 RepID=A0AAV8VJB1_9CUCU|nr:hypothetical protein NQ315_017528 [Exocentrus adspersus]
MFDTESDTEDIPNHIRQVALTAKTELLPKKSKHLYEHDMKIIKTSEDAMLAYVNTALKNYKSSSLWSQYSMLRSTIKLKEGVDISQFASLIPYLKRQGDGYKAKKSLTLTHKDI